MRSEEQTTEQIRLTLDEEAALAGNDVLIESLVALIRADVGHNTDYRAHLLYGIEAMHTRNIQALSRLNGNLIAA